MDKPFDADSFFAQWNGEPETALHTLNALAPTCGYDGRKLAQLFNVSQRHLQRLFSATVSCSPQAWLNERRLHVAWQMLQTADSVKEVAYALGFRRASQFSRDFRRLFGLTPSQACRVTARRHLLPAAAQGQRAAVGVGGE